MIGLPSEKTKKRREEKEIIYYFFLGEPGLERDSNDFGLEEKMSRKYSRQAACETVTYTSPFQKPCSGSTSAVASTRPYGFAFGFARPYTR